MKRENLYFVGGALLASTALTTAASAGTFALLSQPVAFNTSTVSTTARPLSAQVFSATPSTATTIGSNTALAVRFNQSIASKFSMTITAANAKFKTTAVTTGSTDVLPLAFVTFSGTGTVLTTGGSTQNTLGCSIAAATDKLVLADCQTVAGTAGSIGGFLISGIAFDNATGLATAGGSITLAGEVTVSSVSFETTAAQAVVTSRNSMSATVTPNASAGKINVSSSPAFSAVVTSNLSVSLATVNITQAGSVALDLSTSVTGTTGAGAVAAAYATASAIKLTSTSIGDDAVSKVQAIGTGTTLSITATQFSSGFVTLAISGAQSLNDSFDLRLEFNGTGQIDAASAGTVEVVFASAASGGGVASGNAVAPATLSGSTAALSRSGLSIDINGVQPGTAQGARTYTSLLRIANTGTTAGTVAVLVKNEATGATLGTYTSASIPAGASLQVSSAQIEAGAGITAQASIGYRLTVSGSINGYVQHVNWNQDAGFFSDLSANRQ